MGRAIIIFLIVAICIRGCVVEAFKIPSQNMIPTLIVGDHILVSKLSYGIRFPYVKKTLVQYSSPEHGDVVVFTLPDDPLTIDIDESDINIVSRVAALPGDTVEISGPQLYIVITL